MMISGIMYDLNGDVVSCTVIEAYVDLESWENRFKFFFSELNFVRLNV